MISAADIHASIDWPSVLVNLGIPESALKNKHGPCPSCGGKDCFRFDHAKRGNGSFYCNKFGAGDGFKLLEHVHGWTFAEARKRVIEAGRLSQGTRAPISAPAPPPRAPAAIASPSSRVLQLRRERCAVNACDSAIDYLTARSLWPLPDGCALFAHAGLDYFENGERIGRYPALVADVVDLAGDLVTAHVTYLDSGRKLAAHEPRKLLGPLTGRTGCAVRLMPAGPVLGLSEGLENALSAAVVDRIPVWAALNTALLAKFEPPAAVERLVIYADRDEAGLLAAIRLQERLQDRIRAGLHVDVRVPRPPSNDWNDSLTNSREGGKGIS